MARRGLEDRIEAWPDQWREARAEYADAKALVAKLELQLERTRENARRREDEAGAGSGDGYDDFALPGITDTDRHVLELEFQVQRATLAVERARAEADVKTRSSAWEAGQKLTEAAVEARVKSDQGYIASQERLLEVKQQHALAKLERDQQVREEREKRRSAEFTLDAEPETPEVARLRNEVYAAQTQLEKARVTLGYQARVGQTLLMLTEMMKVDSAEATVPLHSR